MRDCRAKTLQSVHTGLEHVSSGSASETLSRRKIVLFSGLSRTVKGKLH